MSGNGRISTVAEKMDYYGLLGVDRGASVDQVRAAYRKLALKYHPDRNPGDMEAERRFKEISEAYDVLSDGQKRRLYDESGRDGLRGTAQRDFRTGNVDDIIGAFGEIFSDSIFADFLGVGRRGRRVTRGASLRVELEVGFAEAALGTKRTVGIARSETCGGCGGSGSKPGTETVTCGTCCGRGMVGRNAGFFMLQKTCHMCGGEGRRTVSPCGDCGGNRVIRVKRTVEIGVPAGVEEGTRFRVAGLGDASPDGGPSGDLYCDIHVRPHPVFRRQGNDVHSEITVGFAQAALGTDVEVETLSGKATLKVPRGTQAGTELRIRGMGVQNGKDCGDQVVTVRVPVPTKLTKRQEEVLREFERLRGMSDP